MAADSITLSGISQFRIKRNLFITIGINEFNKVDLITLFVPINSSFLLNNVYLYKSSDYFPFLP